MPRLQLNNIYNIYKYTALFGLVVIFLFGVAFLQSTSFSENANAETTDTATTDTTVNLTPNISVTATNINIDTIPETSGSWLTGTSHVTVSTNNATGYKLYVSSGSDQVDLVNSSNSNYKIANLANETTESTFKTSDNLMNHYGFTHDNIGTDTASGQVTTGTYLPLTTNNAPRLIKTTTEEQNISETNVTFAAKVDRSIPAGSYENTVTFTAVANDPPMPTMQEFTANDCDKMNTWSSSADDLTLKDARDDNSYTIRKLADGNCWMTDNLRLQDKTLTSADSNVTNNFTLPASSDSGFTEDDSQTAQVHINTTYGGYYNWYTATAGTGTASMTRENATASICPKGWHLPSGGSAGEWKALIDAQGIGTSGAASRFTEAPLSLPLSGYFYGGSEDIQGIFGYWWSRTAYGNSRGAYVLYVDSYGVVDPASYDLKFNGYPVRCVFGNT